MPKVNLTPPKVKITPLAREDIVSIARYTQLTWGVEQRNAYLADFQECFKAIERKSAIGKDRSNIRKGLLSHQCNHHVIFFKRDNDENIQVLRILYERMDFLRHI